MCGQPYHHNLTPHESLSNVSRDDVYMGRKDALMQNQCGDTLFIESCKKIIAKHKIVS